MAPNPLSRSRIGEPRLLSTGLQHEHAQGRSCVVRAINAVSGLAKVLGLGRRDVHKRLRIPIHEREPRALHLDHHPMTAAESVKNVGHSKVNLRHFSRFEWFWL